jgi:hypothetical protein
MNYLDPQTAASFTLRRTSLASTHSSSLCSWRLCAACKRSYSLLLKNAKRSNVSSSIPAILAASATSSTASSLIIDSVRFSTTMQCCCLHCQVKDYFFVQVVRNGVCFLLEWNYTIHQEFLILLCIMIMLHCLHCFSFVFKSL